MKTNTHGKEISWVISPVVGEKCLILKITLFMWVFVLEE